MSDYTQLKVDASTGASLMDEAPVVRYVTPEWSLFLNNSGAGLEVVYYCPIDHESQLQASSDLRTWEPVGDAWSDDIMHQWSDVPNGARFSRVVRR